MNMEELHGYGAGVKIKGIIEEYLANAGENISAGDFVKLVNGGTTGEIKTFEDGTAYSISAATLSSTSVLVAYQDYSNSEYGTAVVLTISGTNIMSGVPTVFKNANTTNISCVALSNTSVLVTYSDCSNSSLTKGTAVILTISGTTITVGTPVVFKDNSPFAISTVALSSTSALVAYHDTTSTPTAGKAKVLTISGTAITSGMEVKFRSGVGTQYISMLALSSTKVLMAYLEGGTLGKVIVLTISGTSIAVGVPVTFKDSSIYYTSLFMLSSTTALLLYIDTSNSNYGTAVILTISGTTITVGTPVVFLLSSMDNMAAVALSSTKVLVSFRDRNSPYYGKFIMLTISGFTITAGTQVVFRSAYVGSISTVALSSANALTSFYDNNSGSKGSAVVINGCSYATKSTNKNEINGVAKNSASAGTLVKAYTLT